jgi:hypothetical protein
MGAAKPENYPTPLLWSKIKLLEKSLLIAKVLEQNDLRLFDRVCALNANACCASNSAETFYWWRQLGLIEPSTRASYPTETHIQGHKVYRFRLNMADIHLRIIAMNRDLQLERLRARGLKHEGHGTLKAHEYGFHNAFHFNLKEGAQHA